MQLGVIKPESSQEADDGSCLSDSISIRHRKGAVNNSMDATPACPKTMQNKSKTTKLKAAEA